jgi:hypothetical protein
MWSYHVYVLVWVGVVTIQDAAASRIEAFSNVTRCWWNLSEKLLVVAALIIFLLVEMV